MDTFLQRIPTEHTWDDLSVSGDTLQELKALATQIQSGKHGVALFTGPSDTGKTMAANVLANGLGFDLYKVDLSSVASKYIGETEKNLSALFEQSKSLGAILLFDEADALFGKRTSVTDAHDRYANLDTGLLLERIEDFEGITILTSNLRPAFDEAFIRRMTWSTDFSKPEPTPALSWWVRLLKWLKLY